MKEISSDCHLNEKRRPLKVADSRRKTRTKQSRKKKNERRVVRKSNQGSLEKEERKSQPEVYKSNSEDTDQQKQGIELIQVITKELRLDFVPPPPFLLILPKKTNKKTYLGSGRMKHNRRDWTTLKKEEQE